MILQLTRIKRRYILVDIDTQKDFLISEGKYCIRNHRKVLANIRRVMAWARINNVPIISTAEVYVSNNGNGHEHYCLDGTEGQRKIHYTLLNKRINLVADGNTDIPRDIFKQYRQIVLNKRCIDPFEEPRIDRLLSEIRASEFILVGAGLESAVKATALGLLQRGKKVTVILDATGMHDKREANLALRKMETKGAKIIDTKKLAGLSHLRLVGACNCPMCRGLHRKDACAETENN